jgi:hypothetical protein
MTDNGETGSSDQLALTIFNKSGGVWFASAWDGVRPHEQTLAGGNIRVNSGESSAKTAGWLSRSRPGCAP